MWNVFNMLFSKASSDKLQLLSCYCGWWWRLLTTCYSRDLNKNYYHSHCIVTLVHIPHECILVEQKKNRLNRANHWFWWCSMQRHNDSRKSNKFEAKTKRVQIDNCTWGVGGNFSLVRMVKTDIKWDGILSSSFFLWLQHIVMSSLFFFVFALNQSMYGYWLAMCGVIDLVSFARKVASILKLGNKHHWLVKYTKKHWFCQYFSKELSKSLKCST